MNEQCALFDQRFERTHRTESLTRDDEEDRTEAIVRAGIERSLQFVEDQAGEQSVDDHADHLRDDQRRISQCIAERSLGHIEQLVCG